MQIATTDILLITLVNNLSILIGDSMWNFSHTPVPSTSLMKKWDGPTCGAGIPMPQHGLALDIDTMAKYFAHHGRPGGTNPFARIVMDYMCNVHR